jgi:transcriptional regulator with XRE-family HTH domain
VNELQKQLEKDLRNEESRCVYADTVTNAFISAQIRSLREQRDLSQDELANLVGTKQSGISRLERSDYSTWKVETLRKLAKAFGVRLRVRFEEFGTLVDEITGFNDKNLLPRKFEDDPAFKEGTRRSHRKTFRRRRRISSEIRKTRRRRLVAKKPPLTETRYPEASNSLNSTETAGAFRMEPTPGSGNSAVPDARPLNTGNQCVGL